MTADVLVWSGDPLETDSIPEVVIIDGLEQPLVTREQRLGERYLQRYRGRVSFRRRPDGGESGGYAVWIEHSVDRFGQKARVNEIAAVLGRWGVVCRCDRNVKGLPNARVSPRLSRALSTASRTVQGPLCAAAATRKSP